jgi:hypothetical protein
MKLPPDRVELLPATVFRCFHHFGTPYPGRRDAVHTDLILAEIERHALHTRRYAPTRRHHTMNEKASSPRNLTLRSPRIVCVFTHLRHDLHSSLRRRVRPVCHLWSRRAGAAVVDDAAQFAAHRLHDRMNCLDHVRIPEHIRRPHLVEVSRSGIQALRQEAGGVVEESVNLAAVGGGK